MGDSAEALTDAEKREKARREFEASPDYMRWRRLERWQAARFRSSVDENKPLFDFVRMIMTTALVGVVAVYFLQQDQLQLVDTVAGVGMLGIAFLLAVTTFQSGVRFTALAITWLSIWAMLPFSRIESKPTRSVVLKVVAAVAFLTMALAVFNLGSEFAQQVAKRSIPKNVAAEPQKQP